MKVALISFLFDSQQGGGAAAVARSVAAYLRDLGAEVLVITTHTGRSIIRDQVDGIKVYRLPPLNLYWVGDKDSRQRWQKAFWQMVDTWNPLVFAATRHILRFERPDLAHVHKLRGLSPSVWAAARSCGAADVIHTCHDYELLSPEGTLSGRFGKWAARGSWPLYPYQSLRAAASRAVSIATSPSRYTLDLHVRQGYFERAATRVVRNAHHLSLAQLADLQAALSDRGVAAAAPLRLLYLGRLEEHKGVAVLCAAFAQAQASAPGLRLEIAGWGSQERLLRERYGGYPGITFHGTVGGRAKGELLSLCDLVVVPSTYREIAPVVISEAYAYGKPVLVSDIGGLPELVDSGRTGWLIRAGSVAETAQLLVDLAADPHCVRQMAPACFEQARRLAPEVVREEYRLLYEQASS